MRFAIAAAVAGLGLVASAQAVTFFSGDTTGEPVFNRPLSLTVLSGVGTAVPYEVTPMFVNTTGSYSVTTDTSGASAYDGYLLLYAGAFDPADPLDSLIAFNDDAGGFTLSSVTTSLDVGTQYFIVQTGFGNTDFGTYTGEIDGVGVASIGLVPEPASLAAVGLAGLGLVRRRRA
ncbi:MAG: PEP-CTERM sorting domain-containing protein [Phycisphaerae bacterium]